MLHPSGQTALRYAREELAILETYAEEAEKRPYNRLAWTIEGRLEMHLIFEVPREFKEMMDEDFRKLLIKREAEEQQAKNEKAERYIDPKTQKMKTKKK